MALAVRTIDFVSEKAKSNTQLNKQLNLANEYQFDTDWWNKNYAIEWWERNGHWNDTLYRDYLLAKQEKPIEPKEINKTKSIRIFDYLLRLNIF